MESMGVVVRRYIDFLILLIPTTLVSALFFQQHPYFLFKSRYKSSIIYNTCQPSRIFRDYPGNSISIPDFRIVVRKSRIFRPCIGYN